MSSLCIVFILALMFQSPIISSEELIYSFLFETLNDISSAWTHSTTQTIVTGTDCTQGNCLQQTKATTSTLTLSTSLYDNLRIMIDAKSAGGGPNDMCKLQYKTTTDTSDLVIVADKNTGQNKNFTITVNNSKSYQNNPNFQIILSAHTKDCYWDNLRVFGIAIPGATAWPTSNPSANPSSYPSKYPTANPSIYPTQSPTNNPSNYPSIPPSIHPSTNPITSYPTTHPSTHPSTSPTHHPSITPSTIPSISPSTPPIHSGTRPPTAEPTSSAKSSSENGQGAPNDVDSPLGMITGNMIILIVLFIVIICVIVITLWLRAYYQRLHKVYAVPQRRSIIKLGEENENVIRDASPSKEDVPDRELQRILTASNTQRVSRQSRVSIEPLSSAIAADELVARELQRVLSASKASIDEQDARLAIQLQLRESGIVDEADANEARESVIKEVKRMSVIDSDARYAQHLQEMEQDAVVDSADARYAIKLQLMESGMSFEEFPKGASLGDSLTEPNKRYWRGSSIGADDDVDMDKRKWRGSSIGADEEIEYDVLQPEASALIAEEEPVIGEGNVVVDGDKGTALVLEDKEKNIIISDVISNDFEIIGDDETAVQGKGEAQKGSQKEEHGQDKVEGDVDLIMDDELDEGDQEEKDLVDGDDTTATEGSDMDGDVIIPIDHEVLVQSPMVFVDMGNDLPDSFDDAHALPESSEDDDLVHVNPVKDLNVIKEDAAVALQKVRDMEADEEYARELQRMLSQKDEQEAQRVEVDSFDVRMAIRLQLMESGVDDQDVFEFAQKQRMSVAADYADDEQFEDAEVNQAIEKQNEAQKEVIAKKEDKEDEDSAEEDVMAGLETLDFE